MWIIILGPLLGKDLGNPSFAFHPLTIQITSIEQIPETNYKRGQILKEILKELATITFLCPARITLESGRKRQSLLRLQLHHQHQILLPQQHPLLLLKILLLGDQVLDKVLSSIFYSAV